MSCPDLSHSQRSSTSYNKQTCQFEIFPAETVLSLYPSKMAFVHFMTLAVLAIANLFLVTQAAQEEASGRERLDRLESTMQRVLEVGQLSCLFLSFWDFESEKPIRLASLNASRVILEKRMWMAVNDLILHASSMVKDVFELNHPTQT